MKTKFDKLFNKIISECKSTKKVVKESANDLPMNVNDAIAQFMYEYLVEEQSYIDWDGAWNNFEELMETGEAWVADDYLQEHYSDPSCHFYDFADAATYDPATNTVTIDTNSVDDLYQVANEDDDELRAITNELNEKYPEINGVKFIWTYVE